MLIKTLDLEVKAEGDDGEVVGYGSVFDEVDSYGDIVQRGAFEKSLNARMPKMLWQHRMDTPIGRWTEVREDDRGLFMRGKITVNSSRGRDAYELAKDGALDGLSIGYMVPKGGAEKSGDHYLLSEIDLYEVSFVTMPANSAATLMGVKAGDMTEREFEAALETLGFDRTARKVIVSKGFKGYRDGLRDAGVLGPDYDLRDADEIKRTLNETLQKMGVGND